MNKQKLLDIFSRIKKDDSIEGFHINSRILFVDGMNTFLRSFAVGNRMNLMGHEVNGLIGFLRSVGSAINYLNPTKVVIVFDGEDGAHARRYLYPQYKANRDGTRIINKKVFQHKEEEQDSQYNQAIRLMDYLQYLPVLNLVVDGLEADDVIGYLTRYAYENYTDSQIYIMSTDTDYLQLVDDRVKVYSPTKKKTYETRTVSEEYGVHPRNYLLYKTLVGDTSDNIPGVHGFGEKNTPILFDILLEENRHNLEDLFYICQNPPKKSVLYERVLNTKKQVEVFYKIINLRDPNILEEDARRIEAMFEEKPGQLRKYDFMKIYSQDRMGDSIPNLDVWLNLFSRLNSYN